MTIALQPLLLNWRAVFPVWGSADWTELTGQAAPELAGAGELWLNDDRPGGSTVTSGPWAGRELAQLIADHPREILGPDRDRMPVLLKFLKPDQWLSVQVHPAGGPEGSKYEAWHIISAGAGSRIIAGLQPNLTRASLADLVEAGAWDKVLDYAPITAGESYFIPAGLVHALGPDMLLFEIQENADITYRFYDWDRPGKDGRPRPLHLKEALSTVRTEFTAARPATPVNLDFPGGRWSYLVASRRFLLRRLETTASLSLNSDELGVSLITCLGGRAEIGANSGAVNLGPGQTVLIPARLGDYRIKPDGRFVALESSAPDLARAVVRPLRAAGCAEADILALAAPTGDRELGSFM